MLDSVMPITSAPKIYDREVWTRGLCAASCAEWQLHCIHCAATTAQVTVRRSLPSDVNYAGESGNSGYTL